MDRRTFLARSAALTAGAWATTLWRPGLATARARTRGSVVDPSGTTLERTLLPTGDGYLRFTEAPGWPIVVRDDLAEAQAGREGRREALATVVHLTDIHVIDGQSPTRVEFVDRYEDPATANPGYVSSAWRPQETLCGHIADAMVQQVREIGAGPVTGRPYDCAVSTGDNTDNMQSNELDWFLGLLDGGRPLQLNSGDPERYEGVQDDDEASFDPAYYHPHDNGREDAYKRDLGFPVRDGMLDAAITAFTPVGLPCPWYSVYGNHDGLIQGNVPPTWDPVATGPLKVVGLPDGLSQAALERILAEQDLGRLLQQPHAPVRTVTPDEERRAVLPSEWVRRHNEDRGGPGPVGHGLSIDHADEGILHFAFDVSDDVLGIGLDTVNRTGYASGSLDRGQLAWLEEQLIAVSSRYYTADGQEVRTDHDDRLVLLFAHHTIRSMDNPLPDLTRPEGNPRVLGDEFVDFLHRFPNVLAFIGGHSHRNAVTVHPSGTLDSGGFYEVETAAHIDYPQHARIVELVDNRDGTLSLFTTLLDHAGPALPPDDARTSVELAALARELGANDVQKGHGGLGGPEDGNVELVLTAPFERRPTAAAPGRARGRGGRDDAEVVPAAAHLAGPGGTEPVLPVTGGTSGAAMVGAALVGGALALRRRGSAADDRDAAPAS